MHNNTNYIITKSTSIHTYGKIVCIHGIGGYTGRYTQFVNYFSQRGYDVLTYDLIGRGESLYPNDNDFSPDAHAKQLRSLIEHIQWNKYSIVAHSMGGIVATYYANQYFEDIQTVVFMSPAGLMDNVPSIHKWLQPICKKVFEWYQYYLRKNDAPELYEMMCTNSRILDAVWQCVLQMPLCNLHNNVIEFSNKNIRTLLLWGTADKVVKFQSNYEKWKNLLPSAKKIIYEGLGHEFYLEEPATVYYDIFNFMISNK